MGEYVCEHCGTRNAFGTAFCASCGSFLAWGEVTRDGALRAEEPSGPAGVVARSPLRSGHEDETVLRPAIRVPVTDRRPVATGSPTTSSVSPDSTRGLFWATADPGRVSVPATGDAAVLELRVANTSKIVDAFVVDAPQAPDWLQVESSQVRLLPSTDEAVKVTLRVSSPTLVPAQEVPVILRVRPVTQAFSHLEVPVLVTVPVVDAPVRLRAEPRLVRVRDRDTAECTLVVDNSGCNRPVQVRFSGSDPELAARFQFDPPALTVGPGGSGSAQLVVTVAGPEPGHESSHTLTVAALEGSRSVETIVTLQQSTTAQTEDPLVSLDVEPSVLRVRDSKVGRARVTVDNRGGREWAHLRLKASDPERVVLTIWDQTMVHVPPGHAVHAEVLIEAPLPDPGTEVSRAVTISATDGRRTASATATFVQASSPSPMGTLVLRLEPSVLRVKDADRATGHVVLDNRRGHAAVRVTLEGRDPERAIDVRFSPAMVEVGPGQTQAVAVQLHARRPDPGQELTRPFTVSAGDGQQSVEATGSLLQSSSPAAIALLTLQLDPAVLRLANRRQGRFTALVDNRMGAQPVQVTMSGDDPENALRFRFSPSRLHIPAGQAATTVVTVDAPRGQAGREVVRPLVVMASEGGATVSAEGSLVQSSVSRRPLVRLLLILLGGLAMFAGAFQPWTPWPGSRGGVGWYLTLRALGRPLDRELDLGGVVPAGYAGQVEGVVQELSLGMLAVALAMLLVLGLTGSSGRLSRAAAVAGVLLIVAVFVFAAQTPPRGADLDFGAYLVLAGCIAGYVGGALKSG